MAAGEEYRAKAAELTAQAKQESNKRLRAEFEALALSYIRLATQADRNSETDLVIEAGEDTHPVVHMRAARGTDSEPSH